MEPRTPAPRALAAIKDPPAPETINKALRITARVRRAVDLMASGKCKTIVEAAEQVGLARESLGRALAIEHMRQRAIRTIAQAAGRAAEVKAELLDCGDSMARDRASSFVLQTAGIGPATAPSVNINLEMRAGYVIDLSGNGYRERAAATTAPTDRHPPKTIDHEPPADTGPAAA
jgi:hypothetical protein